MFQIIPSFDFLSPFNVAFPYLSFSHDGFLLLSGQLMAIIHLAQLDGLNVKTYYNILEMEFFSI